MVIISELFESFSFQLTLWFPRWSTLHFNVASLPIGIVTFSTDPINFGGFLIPWVPEYHEERNDYSLEKKRIKKLHGKIYN